MQRVNSKVGESVYHSPHGILGGEPNTSYDAKGADVCRRPISPGLRTRGDRGLGGMRPDTTAHLFDFTPRWMSLYSYHSGVPRLWSRNRSGSCGPGRCRLPLLRMTACGQSISQQGEVTGFLVVGLLAKLSVQENANGHRERLNPETGCQSRSARSSRRDIPRIRTCAGAKTTARRLRPGGSGSPIGD